MKGQYATLKDVAERAGTTAATVSYVLSGSTKRYISADMRRRVEEAAKELNYVKSSAASSLKGKKRKIIAVLVPQFANQLFTELVLAVQRVADQYGFILSICNTFDDPQQEREVIEKLQAQRVDGFIITSTKEGEKNTRQLRKIGVPVVFVDRTLNIKEDYFLVSVQNYDSVYTATEYLLNHGHRHIAYIGWDAKFGGLEQREQAYHDALEKFGISEEEQIVYNGAFSGEDGAVLTERLLKEHPEVTAVLYAYNIQARGGVDYLASQKIEIGKALSIIVIGAPDWAQVGNNHYTCVDLNGTELGMKAANMLFEIINQEESVIVPYKMSQESVLKEGNSVCYLTTE